MASESSERRVRKEIVQDKVQGGRYLSPFQERAGNKSEPQLWSSWSAWKTIFSTPNSPKNMSVFTAFKAPDTTANLHIALACYQQQGFQL